MTNNELLISIDKISLLQDQWSVSPAPLSARYLGDMAMDTNKDRKQRERIAVRVLLHTLLPDYEGIIQYDPDGKPLLENGMHISISHSNQWAAIAVHPTKAVGIDVEELRPKIVRIADRFLSSAELVHLQQNIRTDYDRLLRYTVYWSAKEALFKWYGQQNIDFRKNLHIHTYNSGTGTIEASIDKSFPAISVLLHCQKLGNEAVCVWVNE